MTAGDTAVLLASALVGVTALLRWGRVAQREHYLPGEVWSVARRWSRSRPPNGLLAGGWLVAFLVAVAAAESTPLQIVGALAAGAIGAAFPWGMRIIGRPPLRWTRRLRSLAAVAGLVALVGAGLIFRVLGPYATLAGIAPLTAASLELALRITAPLEARLARRFTDRAASRLRSIRPRVVAVTGSFGKTTTKNHIRDLLTPFMAVTASPASWNNRAGLARAINEELGTGTEVFVAEMGTYGRGEIAELVDWIHPEVAIISALGPVHLERMGSLENIVTAKSEIFSGASQAIVCVEHPLLRALADRIEAGDLPGWIGQRVWRVGSEVGDPTLDVVATRGGGTASERSDGAALTVEARVEAGAPRIQIGRVADAAVHPTNVACAVAAALALGVQGPDLSGPLETLSAPRSRARIEEHDGKVIVDDTFNSNPEGARAALGKLTGAISGGRLVVVTPGMVELGPDQFQSNVSFAREACDAGATLVVVGWTNRKALQEGARQSASPSQVVAVASREDALVWVQENTGVGDGVLWENDLPDHYP